MLWLVADHEVHTGVQDDVTVNTSSPFHITQEGMSGDSGLLTMAFDMQEAMHINLS